MKYSFPAIAGKQPIVYKSFPFRKKIHGKVYALQRSTYTAAHPFKAFQALSGKRPARLPRRGAGRPRGSAKVTQPGSERALRRAGGRRSRPAAHMPHGPRVLRSGAVRRNVPDDQRRAKAKGKEPRPARPPARTPGERASGKPLTGAKLVLRRERIFRRRRDVRRTNDQVGENNQAGRAHAA